MPEGDTVHKLAGALRPRLVGRRLLGVWTRDRGLIEPFAGRRVTEVSALGKHMLVGIDRRDGKPGADWVLHIHLGMRGRWHRLDRDAPPRLSPARASLALETQDALFVCYRAAVAEVLRRADVAVHPRLMRLGPDLLSDEPSYATIVERARRREARCVAELLLDQTVACGIGNVYKSEVLFVEGIHPETSAASLDDDAIVGLYRSARRLLRANLGGWRRTTIRSVSPGRTPGPRDPRLWVYGRSGEQCRRCATPIASMLLGDDARSSYWCPGCQPRADAAGLEASAR